MINTTTAHPPQSHTDNVRMIVDTILKCKLPTYEKQRFFQKRFPQFAQTMPKLFEMVVRDDLTEDHLSNINMMLDMSSKLLDQKNIEVIDADKFVYGKLREQYIDPVLSLDQQGIKQFMERKEYSEEELHGAPPIKVNVKE